MGRHRNIDSFHLQIYTLCPKHLVRDNLDILLIFKQDFTNLKHTYYDHVNTDMSFKEFCDMCCFCWNSRPYGCLLIDKTSNIDKQ